ncbi:hypothetical protein JCGZ_07232 [Jatropha curcas]|uniref:Uncharacterized protein n=2 Tax=Jatropha curcas TaxID=180498 RepID=A0A067KBR0_JATCU|nr:hypothetical protein JCGZ_07232 [Jatropha curcas]
MGATLVMVVSLAVVLGLVLVLLAELYCTLLLRRRQLRISSTNATAAANTASITTSPPANTFLQPQKQPASSPTTYYAPGVLQAPRSLFFPAISCKENKVTETKNQEPNTTSPKKIGLVNTSPPSTSTVTSPHQACVGCGEHFVYISNPIYDNDANRASRVETPFETPDSSPSRLETDGDDEEIGKPSPSSPHSVPITPPLTPMKKLPKEACSVSLRDARSLGTSGSDSLSNNGLSSSSSGSPCTSPSW